MNESFEQRSLIDRETLHALQQRHDRPSLVRLTLQLSVFLCGAWILAVLSPYPVVATFATVLVAAVWATLFAPFHECTHQTAFRSRWLNVSGAWLTGIPFGMAPAVYREFYFAHHRYTHDPKRDPEIGGAPDQLAVWPTTTRAWLFLISGVWLLMLKARTLVTFSLIPPTQRDRIAPWIPPAHGDRIVQETRVVALCWAALVGAALWGAPGARWLLLALILSHLFQAVWLTTEHTGLPYEGTILARTRTMLPAPWVRWWLWNMNFHAEHHAWPAIPWHALPAAHERVAPSLDNHAGGYWRLQFAVLQQQHRPNGAG